MKTLSAVRAYVSGESFWSKAQKEAVYYLNVYAKTHAESDYQHFLNAIKVPLGDKLARAHLQSPHPDFDKAAQNLILAKNHPDDVPGMMRLFRVFQHTSLLKPAISYWTQGDRLIAQIIQSAEKLHQHVSAGKISPQVVDPLIEKVNQASFELTPLEEAFSNSISEASRKAQSLIAAFMLTVTILLMSLGTLFSRRLVIRDIAYLRTIKESDSNQRALLEAMADGVFVAQDYRFVFINPVLPTMLGYSYEEFIGIPFDQVVAPDFIDLWNQRFTARINDSVEPPKNYQVRFLLKGGKESIWFDLRASKVEFNGSTSVLGILRDISKQKEAEEVIWQQANLDMLTGLPNRRMFRDRLEQEMKNAERALSILAVMFLDLDHFKEVNDTLGHDKGDRLLQEAAKRLKNCVRETDTVARLGGDEFVILLNQMDDSTGLDKIAKHILAQMCKPFELGIDPVYISASIGITLFPVDATEFEDLLKNADQAMYAAKYEGRNRYNYFTASMQTTAKARMRLANDLRQSSEKSEFELLYQPIVEIATGEVSKAEALIRWHHPEFGLLSPAQFIAIAEDTGIIFEIGEWVFRQATQQAAKWRKSFPEFQISINKSPIQFKSENFTWTEYLIENGFPGQSLVIEITEGLLLDASSGITERLQQLRRSGIQIAIDDFGTGYSSLSYLKKYDIDYIKIDQSFVCNIAAGSSDMGLCEAIILMAHKLGMKVVAEGVETNAQLMLLSEAGCDYAQGFLFSKPLSVSEFESNIFTIQHNRFK